MCVCVCGVVLVYVWSMHHTYTNKDVIKHAATLLNYPFRSILIILTKVTLARPNSALPDDGDYTDTCRNCFNINFNVNFKIFTDNSLVHQLGKKF